jgi:PadR family transcriptional regulator, regulatory protein PadR
LQLFLDLGKISSVSGPIRVTGPLLDVLEVFLQAFNQVSGDEAELHGWAIMKATKRSGPTVYGVLDRLEDAGWITGRWENQHPEQNKPRRRFYQLTPTGVAAARDLLTVRRPQALHYSTHPASGLAFLRWFTGCYLTVSND